MKTKMLSACLVLASLSWGSGVQAATVFTTPTSIGGRVVLYPLQLSASGYVNNQSIDATLSNAALNQPVRGEYGFTGTFKPIPTWLSIIATVLDDRPDGSSCASIGGDKTIGCADGDRGDAELEYLQLSSRAGATIQIDESTGIWPIEGPGTQALFATTLGELPLSSLAALQISEQLKVTGDLYINQVYLAVGFQEREIVSTNAVPVPPAVWLFGSALAGILGVTRNKPRRR